MSQPITLTLARKAPRPLLWLGVLLVLGLLSMPFLALLPQSHPLAVSTWLLTLSGKILCYAIVAVALDLVWGYAGMLLFFRNETGFGGNNGFTGFTTLLGYSVTATTTRAALFMVTVLLLLLTLGIGYLLAQSKFGRILTAVRDAENRLMFCGYDPRGFKLLVWTLSAVLCGLAGALYVPQVGIINPSEMSPTNSIEAAIWVALGGRGTLIGPVLGAGLVNGAKSLFTVTMPEYWQLFLGLIFIIVTLFLPRGVIGLLRKGDR
ncbi:TPA: ABC transporter permease subunit [Raoultella planticola]